MSKSLRKNCIEALLLIAAFFAVLFLTTSCLTTPAVPVIFDTKGDSINKPRNAMEKKMMDWESK